MCGELVLAQYASEDGEKLEGPPLGALHHGPRHPKSKELLATSPIKGLASENWLHELLEKFPINEPYIDFLGHVV